MARSREPRPVPIRRETQPVREPMAHEKQEHSAEQREAEVVRVARLFLFQSRKPEEILDTDSVSDLYFTDLLLIQKGGDTNPGQVMPLGGKIDEGENPLQAAIREAVEEAHLRPAERTIRPVGTSHHYEFEHPRKGRQKREALYFKGKLGPQDWDVPYQLHPEEDKIAGFVHFSPAESVRLFETDGQVEKNGEVYTVQDALHPHQDVRLSHGTDGNESERALVAENLTLHHYLTDARKKVMILGELLMDVPREDISAQGRSFIESLPSKELLIQRIHETYRTLVSFEGMTWEEAVPLLPIVDDLWNSVATQFTVQDIRMAFVRSDHHAKLNSSFNYRYDRTTKSYVPEYDQQTGKGVPTVALIFPLLLNDHVRPDNKMDIRRMREIRRNPTMRMMTQIVNAIRRELRKNPNASDEVIINELHSAGLVSPASMSFGEMSLEIDMYFEELRDAAGLTDEDAPLDQLEEIKLASLADLFRFASSSLQDIQQLQQRVSTEAEARVFQWEAQRKLVLLLLLNEAVKTADQLKEYATAPIDVVQQMAMTDLHSPLRLYAGRVEHKKRPNGNKELMSLLRKMIVRDRALNPDQGEMYVAHDFFAESYIFNNIPGAAIQPMEFQLPNEFVGRIFNAKGAPVDSMVIEPVMRDVLVSLLQQDPRVRILEYKPFPPSGGKIMSSGPGGGGNIRFGKFYIEHTDDDGISRRKEIQVFIPDPVTGLSGSDEYQRKKEDDRVYAVQRLFHTKGIRSFMEVLFPAIIYDQFNNQSRAIFSQRVG